MTEQTKRTLACALLPLAVVMMLAYAFHGVKPEPTGQLIYRAALFFGGISAAVGFLAGLLARKAR